MDLSSPNARVAPGILVIDSRTSNRRACPDRASAKRFGEKPMIFNELGTTGYQVSRLGVGLAALGRPGYINVGHATDLAGDYDIGAMETRAHAVLDAAWEAGV